MELNIWACNKDISIKHLLLLLREEFSESAYHILDTNETDARSVRLGNPDDSGYSIYIYTYGQEQDHYGVHLEYRNSEYINTVDNIAKDTVEIFDGLSYNNLLDLLQVHFTG